MAAGTQHILDMCTTVSMQFLPAFHFEKMYPANGIVGRVTDCRVRGLRFKSPGSIITYRTETISLSWVVRDGWDPCSELVSW